MVDTFKIREFGSLRIFKVFRITHTALPNSLRQGSKVRLESLGGLLDIDHRGSPVCDGGVGIAVTPRNEADAYYKDREEIFHG